MANSRYSLSFRVWHPSMSATEVAAKVGMTPRIQHSAGEPRKTPKGDPLPGHYKGTFCTFPMSKGDFSAFESALRAAISQLQRAGKELLDIATSGGRAEFFIGLFLEGNEGMVLDDGLLKAIADMRLTLSLDLYGADGASED